jgi:hypothetical protein
MSWPVRDESYITQCIVMGNTLRLNISRLRTTIDSSCFCFLFNDSSLAKYVQCFQYVITLSKLLCNEYSAKYILRTEFLKSSVFLSLHTWHGRICFGNFGRPTLAAAAAAAYRLAVNVPADVVAV